MIIIIMIMMTDMMVTTIPCPFAAHACHVPFPDMVVPLVLPRSTGSAITMASMIRSSDSA